MLFVVVVVVKDKGSLNYVEYNLTLNTVLGVCSRLALEFRDQEYGNMPRTKMERKVSRLHFKHICLDKVPEDVPRR